VQKCIRTPSVQKLKSQWLVIRYLITYETGSDWTREVERAAFGIYNFFLLKNCALHIQCIRSTPEVLSLEGEHGKLGK
jgi:hypothetical protein